MDQNKTKYSAFLTRLQEELMTAATQHAVAWRFGNWSARERLLTVHERLLRDVRKNLQRLNTMVLKKAQNSGARSGPNSSGGRTSSHVQQKNNLNC